MEINQKVYSQRWGYGIIIDITLDLIKPVLVKFECGKHCTFTRDGRLEINSEIVLTKISLSLTDIFESIEEHLGVCVNENTNSKILMLLCICLTEVDGFEYDESSYYRVRKSE